MCGRYYIDDKLVKEIEKLVPDVKNKLSHSVGPTDIFPSQSAIVLHNQNGNLSAAEMKWGFPRYGTKELLINARAETLQERPTFKESAKSRRCIIPSRGFYEWNYQKEKIAFTHKNHSILYMAGIYNIFENELCFTIITTKANASVQSTHTRMPLVLEPHELESWIFDSEFTSYILNGTPVLLQANSEYQQQSLFD